MTENIRPATVPDLVVLAEALPAAWQAGQLRLVYQPQLTLETGRVVGVEALLRWDSPQFGAVAPDRLVAAAEAGGLIVPLGDWVLDEACRQTAAWRAAGLAPVRVGVNLAAGQFVAGDLAERVRRALARHGLPASALGLEITERALQDQADRIADALRPLQAEGVEISLDDFGTGYSSLLRLRELPLDVVKIDRSYVHDVAADPARASVTRSVIHLAHALRLRVMAEGVETEEQTRLLAGHGCDLLQGWVFSRAVEAEQVASDLRSGRGLARELTRQHVLTRTLLLVDDEAHILAALRRLFRRDGYEILTATSADEALTLLGTHRVDVIVSDQRMPGMSGVDFLRRAKVMCPETVRMTLSGYTDLQSIIDAVNEGSVYKFLTKPWEDDRLRDHVAEAFRQHELAAENRRLTREISAANTGLAQANRRLEGLVAREHDRVRALVDAAGAVRDLLDLVPLAVFGFDPDGTLAFANGAARAAYPVWSAGLGGAADPALIDLLGRAGLQGRGRSVRLPNGQLVDALRGELRRPDGTLGQVLILGSDACPDGGRAADLPPSAVRDLLCR